MTPIKNGTKFNETTYTEGDVLRLLEIAITITALRLRQGEPLKKAKDYLT